MKKYAMGISYQGTCYAGFQRQTSAVTIQSELEKALSFVAASEIKVTCAGRTDTGVHALGQVVHFETHAARDNKAWLLGTNVNLPPDIRVEWIVPVNTQFHARFGAIARTYRYVIYNDFYHHPLYYNLSTWCRYVLDLPAMQQAAQAFLGEQDFSAFRSSACQSRHAVRQIHNLTLERQDKFILFEVTANAFLHHMVRNMIGSLLEIGSAKQPVNWIEMLLHAKDRKLAGPTASAKGLYLVRVDYPAGYFDE
ncbi:MAG: tRNA pseudouridine(38-40) synthase TruA [Pseudomonadota bacterium]